MHVPLGVNPQDLLGLLHAVVKRIILCLCILKSIGGKLILETVWGGDDFFTFNES